MKEEIVIEELNTLLRGTYMAIRSFEHYIEKMNSADLKKKFQSMQKELKRNAEILAERIQNLGGVPADDEGFTGSIHSFMHKVKLPDDDKKIIEDAIEGYEKFGISYSEKLVRGDLDPESRQISEKVINISRKHSEELQKLLHGCKRKVLNI